MPQAIDYAALAEQARKSTPVDYSALAEQARNSGVVEDSGTTQEKPGYFKRLGQSLGIPTSEEELKAAMPTKTDLILPPGIGTAAKIAVGYGKTAYRGIKEGAQDVSEAVQNVRQGGPVGANAGKAASGVLHGVLQSTPIIGPSIETAGQDISQKNYAGAAGGLTGVIGQVAAPELIKGAKGVPEVARAGYRKIGNPYGLASTGEELLTQGISPYAKATGFKNALAKAGSDIKAFDADNPIKGVQDLNDAIPEIKQKIWSEEVEPALQRQGNKPVNMKPVADAVRKQITPEMSEFDAPNADKLEQLSVRLENARDVTSANRLLKYVNGQLDSYFAKYPSARRSNLMTNPETAGWEAARQSLREEFLGTLEKEGETGVRDARLRYGALEEIGKQVERRVNVADRAKPMSIHRILGLIGAVPTGGLSIAAGELGNYLNKPDVLIRRGVSKLALPEAIAIEAEKSTPSATRLSDLMKDYTPTKKSGVIAKLRDMFGSNKELDAALAEMYKKNREALGEPPKIPGQGSNAFDKPKIK